MTSPPADRASVTLESPAPAVGPARRFGAQLRRQLQLWTGASQECAKCLGLGVRDLLSVRLILRSALLAIAASSAWIWVYYHYFPLVSQLGFVLALIGAFGLVLGGFQGLTPLPAAPASIAGMASIATGLLQVAQAFLVVAALLLAAYVLFYLFAVACTVRVFVPHLLLPHAARKVGRRYPACGPPVAKDSLRPARRWWPLPLLLLGCLCVPMLAAVVLALGACYLNVRLIYGSVARRSGQRRAMLDALDKRWRPLLLIGMAILVLLLIPLLNLVVPSLMCTAVLHLAHRSGQQQPSNAATA